jgi:putative transposase
MPSYFYYSDYYQHFLRYYRHLSARGYFAATSVNVTDEVIAQYTESHCQIERACDDDFTVE